MGCVLRSTVQTARALGYTHTRLPYRFTYGCVCRCGGVCRRLSSESRNCKVTGSGQFWACSPACPRRSARTHTSALLRTAGRRAQGGRAQQTTTFPIPECLPGCYEALLIKGGPRGESSKRFRTTACSCHATPIPGGGGTRHTHTLPATLGAWASAHRVERQAAVKPGSTPSHHGGHYCRDGWLRLCDRKGHCRAGARCCFFLPHSTRTRRHDQA